ncbi:hypothetical protein Rhe02_94090 [Rhizocola hellebori]|uniref:DUF4233 domain-containing protein n=1 Tax=Rhizocola hellebori TaxID=1392758 RepID=A0A8J3QJS2_9ACTN|nr:DUF4233 domain-containing protein [Rhizocola hellebori]GIH11342.1 hypothetical protein Rhe02_94090 [Rhizocola hellebori]
MTAQIRPGPGDDKSRRPVEMTFEGKPSGLRNPSRSLRSLAAMMLALEALVLLMAIQPIRVLDGSITGGQIGAIVFCAVAAILLTGRLDKSSGWTMVSVLQVVLVLCGLQHWLIGAVGVFFGAVWLYVLYVRRRVLL